MTANATIKQRAPHYYKDFRCTASECRDNCCVGGWQIDIDDETLDYYKALPGSFGESLRENIDFANGCFKLKNGRCPFLDNNNLCAICCELGFEHIGVVCDQFPRYTEYYGNVKERGIGLACKEAARIIISDRQPLTYDENPTAEEPFLDDEYDAELAEGLFKLRKLFTELAENLGYTFAEKMSAILFAAESVQKEINENNFEAIKNICNNFPAKFLKQNNSIKQNNSSYFDAEDGMRRVWYAYLELETLGDEWNSLSEQTINRLHPEEQPADGCLASNNNLNSDNAYSGMYSDLTNKFSEYMSNNYSDDLREYENLLKYYIFRYMMKAAYDHDLLGKIQLAAANMLILRDIETACFAGSIYQYSHEDRMNIIHIFSREVEYSEENISSLYEEFIFDEIFSAQNLSQIFRKIFR